jgi:hypothetical protein
MGMGLVASIVYFVKARPRLVSAAAQEARMAGWSAHRPTLNLDR